jgi:hypothetical protein
MDEKQVEGTMIDKKTFEECRKVFQFIEESHDELLEQHEESYSKFFKKAEASVFECLCNIVAFLNEKMSECMKYNQEMHELYMFYKQKYLEYQESSESPKMHQSAKKPEEDLEPVPEVTPFLEIEDLPPKSPAGHLDGSQD